MEEGAARRSTADAVLEMTSWKVWHAHQTWEYTTPKGSQLLAGG